MHRYVSSLVWHATCTARRSLATQATPAGRGKEGRGRECQVACHCTSSPSGRCQVSAKRLHQHALRRRRRHRHRHQHHPAFTSFPPLPPPLPPLLWPGGVRLSMAIAIAMAPARPSNPSCRPTGPDVGRGRVPLYSPSQVWFAALPNGRPVAA
ncbi:hypothetical protein BGZ61DRAFT_149071 [Ilyonectria robusta]|uniref:uncharacterized protein n=1 Tax=Ilyonectria robusta TaxID=1079257 RepID=UPI001E8E2973|nr:uncharacterized protein BGZ61DRAFT_149071 [Ilyonectria robusta]KAH8661264.1 hypothetical protein BGZ61DRAFT_149071 [Ilyonectria robusta]